MNKKLANINWRKILIPVFSILSAFIIGAIIILASGKNPLEAFSALFSGIFGNAYYMGEWLFRSVPIILTGLAVAFAFRTGLFNIGAAGQLAMGGLAAVFVGIFVQLPWFLHMPLMMIAGALTGFLWGLIPGILKARYRVHEVVVSIMLNYTALYFVNYSILNFIPNPTNPAQSAAMQATATLKVPGITELVAFIFPNSRLNFGFLLAIAACIVFAFIINKTTFGYELRAVGQNPSAAQYAGMKVNRNIALSMAIAGAFAGLAGAIYMTSLGKIDVEQGLTGYYILGFDGIAVALLGNSTGIGVFLSALLLGGLKAGAASMQAFAQVPAEIVEIMSSLILLFVASGYLFERNLDKWAVKRAHKEQQAKVEVSE
ncbi:MAG: ABC transporter permease [Culicoidibacterales bacterium]